ncbi:MAG TPA: Mbeg1-like protein, partial [Chloroflexota bacterium]|nr:Mbeg1-like protein [Chloroflexota bacterium]
MTGKIYVRLLVVACVVLMTALPTVERAYAANGSTSRQGDPDWSHRYIMLIPGIQLATITSDSPGQRCTVKGRQRQNPISYAGGFNDLIGQILDAGQGYKIRYFSYFERGNCPHPTWYYPSDTHETLEASASALNSQLSQIVQSDSQATFDVVGHSLGGVVAAYFVVHDADTDMLQRIHSVITFDSPVLGITPFDTATSALLSGPVLFDLQPGSAAIQAINDSSSGLVATLTLPSDQYAISTSSEGDTTYTNNNRVYTISNDQDNVIMSSTSQLNGARANNTINDCPIRVGSSADIQDSIACHSYVLRDPQAMQWAMDFINSTIGPAWSVTVSADSTDVSAGTTVNLTAEANADVGPTPDSIEIVDQTSGTVVASCGSGTTCTAQVALDGTTDTFVAGVTDESNNNLAQSDPVSVTWESDAGSVGGTVNLGGVDLNSYCQSQGYTQASLDGDTADDWHCDDDSGNLISIDMNAACQWQYSDSNATAVMGDLNDPNSWSC